MSKITANPRRLSLTGIFPEQTAKRESIPTGEVQYLEDDTKITTNKADSICFY